MHTRCTHCDTAFRITPEVLTYARGRVRCGQCMRTFDALEHLGEEAGTVLIPATAEAPSESAESDPNPPNGEQTARDIPGNEENTPDPEPASYNTGRDGPEMEAVSLKVDEYAPGNEEDPLDAELASPLPGGGGAGAETAALDPDQDTQEDKGDMAEAQKDSFIAQEDAPLAEPPAAPHSEYYLPEAETAVFKVAGDTPGPEEDTPNTVLASYVPVFDTAGEATQGIPSEEKEKALKTEPASFDPGFEIQEKETPTFDADQGSAEDLNDAAEVQQSAFASAGDTFEIGQAPITDEDDTLDGDLDLAVTDSWKLDEELLNTSTLPALPGLVEHPEFPEPQESSPDPVDAAKAKPQMNWDDSWDDMSFDDEHGIPLMEDLEEVTETGEQAAAVADSTVENIRVDPAATLTEADLSKMDVRLPQQAQAGSEPKEAAWEILSPRTEGPAEGDEGGLSEGPGDPAIMVTDTERDLIEPDFAELAEEIDGPVNEVEESDRDAIERDLAELAEAIEHAANRVTDTGQESTDSDAWNPAWAGPDQVEGAVANRGDEGPDGLSEPVPGTDLAKVQAELEGLAQLVGMGAGEIPGKSGQTPTAENFEHIVRKRRSGWNLAATGLFLLLLVTILGTQLIHYHRASLLPDAIWGPMLRQTYARLGIDLPHQWELDRYDIRQLGGIQDPARPGVLVIGISVRNQANRAQPFPVIRLVLEDRWGERIAKRDLKPADYLDSEPGAGAMMFAGQLIKTDIAVVEPEGAGATTFQVDACIEMPGGTLDCANQL